MGPKEFKMVPTFRSRASSVIAMTRLSQNHIHQMVRMGIKERMDPGWTDINYRINSVDFQASHHDFHNISFCICHFGCGNLYRYLLGYQAGEKWILTTGGVRCDPLLRSVIWRGYFLLRALWPYHIGSPRTSHHV